LPGGPAGKEVKVDMTIREEVVLPIEERPVLRGSPEYEDLPADARVRVYSLREIAAEKVVALLDRARHEPRDLYDLWHLVEHSRADLGQAAEAITRKLVARNRGLRTLRGALRQKEGVTHGTASGPKLWRWRQNPGRCGKARHQLPNRSLRSDSPLCCVS